MAIAYGAADDASAGYAKRVTIVIGADGNIEHAEHVGDIKDHVDRMAALLVS